MVLVHWVGDLPEGGASRAPDLKAGHSAPPEAFDPIARHFALSSHVTLKQINSVVTSVLIALDQLNALLEEYKDLF